MILPLLSEFPANGAQNGLSRCPPAMRAPTGFANRLDVQKRKAKWSYEWGCAKMRSGFDPSAPGWDLSGKYGYGIEIIALAIDKIR